MKKALIYKALFGTSLVLALSLGAVSVQAQVTNGDDDGVTGGGTTGSGTNSGTVTNGDDDTTGGTNNPGSNGGNGNPAGTVTNGDDDLQNPGGNNPGGNSNDGDDDDDNDNDGRNRNRNRSSDNDADDDELASGDVQLGMVNGQCIYLLEYLKLGRANNPAEVRKLQLFLKNSEGLDVDVTNVFDAKTFRAVEAFQAKYTTDVLGPWGATIPSGQVYISTTKKINELYCNKPFAFTSEDIAIFNAFKAKKAMGIAYEDADDSDHDHASPSPSVTGTPGSDDSDDNSNTAAAAEGSSAIANFFKRIWNFIFGR